MGSIRGATGGHACEITGRARGWWALTAAYGPAPKAAALRWPWMAN